MSTPSTADRMTRLLTLVPYLRARPEGVPLADYGFSATRMPPDDPALIWPVFLGQVTRGGPVDKRTYAVNPADRPYAGLVGESVLAPSGETRVQIGQGAERNDPSGFAVFIPALADRVGRVHVGHVVVPELDEHDVVCFDVGDDPVPRPGRLERAAALSAD